VQAKAMSAYDFATLRAALASYIADPAARETFMRIEPQAAPAQARLKPWLISAAIAAALVLGLAIWWIVRPAPSAADFAAGSMASTDKSATDKGPDSKADSDKGQATGKEPAATTGAALAAPGAPAEPAMGAMPPGAREDKAAKAEKKSSRDIAKDAKGNKGGQAPVPAASSAPGASAAQEAATASAQARARNATLRFQISGLAEIWVDGLRVGPSGSVLQYAVTPGEHRIQIRDCGFPPDTKHQSVSVEPNASKLIVASC